MVFAFDQTLTYILLVLVFEAKIVPSLGNLHVPYLLCCVLESESVLT